MQTTRFRALRFSTLCATALLAACGGGGGGGSSSTLPPVQAPPAGGSQQPAQVAFTIVIPAASGSSVHRRPRSVSAGTKSALIAYSGSTHVLNCTTTCSGTLSLMPGTITFQVGLYDAADGAGNVLASGQTTAVILSGQNNVIALTFGGVVSQVAVALGAASVTAGTAATIPVTVTAKDAAGYTIVGNDPFVTAIALSSDDASGATALSTTALTAPGAAATLSYSGSAAFSGLHISASVPGTTARASVALAAVAAPLAPPPPGTIPAHVQTWYYYGLSDVNLTLPVSYMVSHADYVEDDGFTAQHAEAFKDAGGRYAVAYTDPAYVPACAAPFAPPAGACAGPIGNLVSSDESAWFHGANGARINRYDAFNGKYQEALDPAAPAARNAYAAATAAIVAHAPKLDYFFADDSGGPYTGPDGTTMSGWFYGFSGAGTEIASDTAFISAERGMLASAVRPVIVNGSDPGTALPSYNGAWLDSPNVSGDTWEGCFSDGTNVAGTRNSRWVQQSNAFLVTLAHRSIGLCMMSAAATPLNRVYELASWWMTYDPTYSVAAPLSPAADNTTVFPEFDIVPRRPLATAAASVGELSPANNVYVREFVACYQAGQPIGGCAAIVNIGTSGVAVPALRGHYTAVLSVDAASAYAGGRANWAGPVPSTLGALSAVVLR